MTVLYMVRSSGSPEHASAARRLTGARDEQSRKAAVLAAAIGADAQETAQDSLGEANAAVASRQQWLHWVDEGESLAPWADGEWAATGFGPADVAPSGRGRNPSVRDEAAGDRDRRSAERDRVAAVRDRLADAHDSEVAATLTPRRVDDTYQRATGREIVFRAQRERERAADHRHAAAEQRAQAALDRDHSRQDREMAAQDRHNSARGVAP